MDHWPAQKPHGRAEVRCSVRLTLLRLSARRWREWLTARLSAATATGTRQAAGLLDPPSLCHREDAP